MLRRGGDTDTNACIAGGLIGAYLGESNIKKEWIQGLLSFNNRGSKDEPKVFHKRPEYLIPKHSLLNELEFIVVNAP